MEMKTSEMVDFAIETIKQNAIERFELLAGVTGKDVFTLDAIKAVIGGIGRGAEWQSTNLQSKDLTVD